MENGNAENQLNAILKPYGLKWNPLNTKNLDDEMSKKKLLGVKKLRLDQKKEVFHNITTFWGEITVEDSVLYAEKIGIGETDSKLFKDFNKIGTLTNRVGSFGFSLGYTFAHYSIIERVIAEKMKSEEDAILEYKKEFKMMYIFNESEALKQVTKKIIKRMVKVKEELRDNEKKDGLAKEIEEFIENHYDNKDD